MWHSCTCATQRSGHDVRSLTGTLVLWAPETGAFTTLSTSGSGGWANGPSSNFGYRDFGSAVMYDGRKILLVGGNQTPRTRKAEVINLDTGAGASWRYVDSMGVARRQLNATLLADGRVLVTGGSTAAGFNTSPSDSKVLAAEVWDPMTERWSQWDV